MPVHIEHERAAWESWRIKHCRHASYSKNHNNQAFWIAGVDEVGRGPLAGPVVACAFMVNFNQIKQNHLPWVDDSKSISAKKRADIAQTLKAGFIYRFGAASTHEIDHINILNASKLAMQRAIMGLRHHPSTPPHFLLPDFVLIDGNQALNMDIAQKTIVKGDKQSFLIAAASILAKQCRDDIMKALAKRYPHFGFERHAGYGVKQHLEALRQYAPCPHHRYSFKPLKQG